MAKLVLSLESEYALHVPVRDAGVSDRSQASHTLVGKVGEVIPSLPGPRSLSDGDLFLANGARVYVDQGAKVEFAQPECTSPEELVRHVLAGERILLRAADQAASDGHHGFSDAMIYRCNVDYVSRATWGCHENYLIQPTDPVHLAENLIPHLVSRIIYTGEGGWHPFTSGLEFSLSPRAAFFEQSQGTDSTHDRPIFHFKDEPLCGKGQRLHVICGANLSSQLATYLKVATTALIATLVMDGLTPGTGVRLHDAPAALHKIAASTDLRATVELNNRCVITPLQIQRHYLNFVSRHMHSDLMPDWAPRVCEVWADTLDRLERGPDAVAGLLDWAIKLQLYRAYAAEEGFDQDAVRRWNTVVANMARAMRKAGWDDDRVAPDQVLASHSAVRDEAETAARYLKCHGMAWADMHRFYDLRDRLREADLRFGQLGKGIFDLLDARGVLGHRIENLGSVDQAVQEAPAGTRARLRAQVVRRLHNCRGESLCDWRSVVATQNKQTRVLDLDDPFENEERWRRISEDEAFEQLHGIAFDSRALFGSPRRRRRIRP